MSDNNQELVATTESKSLATQENPASTLMTVIERVAEMPDLDIDRVERLFAMHQQMLDRDAESAYNFALANAQRDMQSVVANKTNDHTKSGYANLEAIHAQCKPIWTANGFSVSATLKPSAVSGHVLVCCEVRHAAGFKQEYENDWPLDMAGAKGGVNKTAIQAMGSTASYARRYTELMIFDIAIKHEDNDGNAQKNPATQSLTNAQIKNVRDAMAMAGVDDAYVCKKAGINTVEELHQGRLQGLIKHLNGKANSNDTNN